MRSPFPSLIAGIALAGLTLPPALRIMERDGKAHTRRQLADAQRELNESYDRALEKAIDKVERAEKAVVERDFETHFQWAEAYSVMRRYRNLKRTEGRVAQDAPDEEFLRIVDLCRECAVNSSEVERLNRFEAGRVYAGVDPEN